MPPVRFWFILLRAFIVTAGGVLVAQISTTGIVPMTWLMASIMGVVAAANAGHVAWPELPMGKEESRRA